MQYILNEEEYEEFLMLKMKNTALKKNTNSRLSRCPICNYVVDNCVPSQNYCDRCGQKLK